MVGGTVRVFWSQRATEASIFFYRPKFFFLIPQDDRGVNNFFIAQNKKKSRSDFFWRRPLGFFDPTGRPRRQFFFYAKKNRGASFFGVDRWGAFSKKRTPKAEKNDWLRALIKKVFYSKKFTLPGIYPTLFLTRCFGTSQHMLRRPNFFDIQ